MILNLYNTFINFKLLATSFVEDIVKYSNK